MMYRNRKRESLHGGVVARALLACLYFGAVGIGYVWHKNQIYRLGDDIKRREAELAAVDKRTTVLAAHLAQLKSPAQLEARNQQYNLGLVTPRDAQIVRFLDPGPDWDTTNTLPPPAAAASSQRPAPGGWTRARTDNLVARR